MGDDLENKVENETVFMDIDKDGRNHLYITGLNKQGERVVIAQWFHPDDYYRETDGCYDSMLQDYRKKHSELSDICEGFVRFEEGIYKFTDRSGFYNETEHSAASEIVNKGSKRAKQYHAAQQAFYEAARKSSPKEREQLQLEFNSKWDKKTKNANRESMVVDISGIVEKATFAAGCGLAFYQGFADQPMLVQFKDATAESTVIESIQYLLPLASCVTHTALKANHLWKTECKNRDEGVDRFFGATVLYGLLLGASYGLGKLCSKMMN
jgi:hypothetical protein